MKSLFRRFDDFDDAIDEAIEEDVGELGAGEAGDSSTLHVGAGRGRDVLSESQRPIRSQGRAARSRRRRRLNDLESDSTAAESEDEFMLSNR